jgi:undecaprenyl-diphosphatase
VETLAVVGAGAALAGSWIVVAAGNDVPAWEAEMFHRNNGLPDALWPAFWPVMQFGSLAGSIGVAAATHAIARDRRLTFATLCAGQAAWWSAKVVKRLARRGRPEALLVDVRMREPADGLGFVSGHAAVSFALTTVLAPSLPPPWRPVAFAESTLVAVARMYAGAHLPLDVVGGAGVGVLTGIVVRWVLGLGGAGVPAATRPATSSLSGGAPAR